ncbi:MAG: leucine-rich repeat domain-containing protein [Clostridiales bacterium]|nr:leucine-rich repeat domain-containing protein [Clostridiales bacterium]
MEIQYTLTGSGVCIDRIADPDALVIVPEEIEGHPVTSLGAYVLSGTDVEEVRLPSRLVRIGAYGFYGCRKLARIYCHSRVLDLGAGLFADAQRIELLDITEYEGEKSCFKDLLSELRQTLRVRVHRVGRDGETREARLIFPEYYEEWVENTPARITFAETHGCGHRYRYCFVNREFQYAGYDGLFAHVKVQEPEELVTELAIGRLLYSNGLTEEHAKLYRAYVREHWETAGRLLIAADGWSRDGATNLEAGRLPWLVELLDEGVAAAEEAAEPDAGRDETANKETIGSELGQPACGGMSSGQMAALIAEAQRAGDTEMVSWLMDFRHRRFRGADSVTDFAGVRVSGREPEEKEPRRSLRKRRFEL